MSTRVLRWGLLGTARINRAVIPPLRNSARNELVAVASRTALRAEAYAREWKIPRFLDSYEALLADPHIDVIYISLPNSLHAEWAVKAAQAGKHVLCEKPIAVTVPEVDAIIAAAGRAHVVVAEAYMYRHHPQTIKVKELVESGVLGDLRFIHGTFTYLINERINDKLNVRLDASLSGGSIWDVGCYPLSFIRTIVGPAAARAEVFGWQVTGATGVDEQFTGQIKIPDAGDVYAQFDCGFRESLRTRMEIVGTKGVITVRNPFKPSLGEQITLTQNGEEQVILSPDQDLYSGEVEDMANAVLFGKAPRVSLDESRDTIALIIGLLRSAREGRPVKVPDEAVA